MVKSGGHQTCYKNSGYICRKKEINYYREFEFFSTHFPKFCVHQ